MNKHNDTAEVMLGRIEKQITRLRCKAYYQELIARRGIGLKLSGVEKRQLLRLRAFQLLGKEDEAVQR